MISTAPIHTRPDGSIDTAHYIRIGRGHRSAAFRSMVSSSGRARRRTGLLAACLLALGLPGPR
jgi:hypothetical protein